MLFLSISLNTKYIMGHCTVRQFLEDYIKTPTTLLIEYEGERFYFNPHVMGILRENNEWYTEGSKLVEQNGQWANGDWVQLPSERITIVSTTGNPVVSENSPHFHYEDSKARFRRVGFAARKA